VATVAYPNGLTSTFTYNTLNRLTAMTTTANSTPVSSYNYQLEPTGNRLSATGGTGRTLAWNFDGIYRLTNETIANDPSQNNGSVGYGLDPVGNRLSENSSLPGINSGSWGYNADDEVSSETSGAGGVAARKPDGAWTSGKQGALPTFPHPRLLRRAVIQLFRCATLTLTLVQNTGQSSINPMGIPDGGWDTIQPDRRCPYWARQLRVTQSVVVQDPFIIMIWSDLW
jgi:YD repeat-containing protein